jgi:menaquinone-dependent protoporphyrinogen oxidase
MDKQISVLVAYASKHGATKGIAEFIADRLGRLGARAQALPIRSVHDLTGYDAVVIGSAVYYGFWLKEAARFVRRNGAVLAERPVWLFSSGPLGTEAKDAQGQDLRATSVPKIIAEFNDAIGPRDHRVFFGALNRRKLGIAERAVAKMPASKALLPEGDFRDWADISDWATGIARALEATQSATR